MFNAVKYSERPFYYTLAEIEQFNEGYVLCLLKPTPYNVFNGKGLETRLCAKGTFIIFKKGIRYILGDSWETEPNFSLPQAQLYKGPFTDMMAFMRMATFRRGKQIYIRQTGPNRGKGFYFTNISNEYIHNKEAKRCSANLRYIV